MVGGRDQDIAKFEEKLKGRGINCTRVRTSHAFHTPMMEKAAQEFEKMLSGFTINEPPNTHCFQCKRYLGKRR